MYVARPGENFARAFDDELAKRKVAGARGEGKNPNNMLT